MTTTTKTEPTAQPTLNACHCGCGETCKGTFAQGHDARHCKNLRLAVEAGTLTRQAALAQLTTFPLLAAKLTRSLDLAAERTAARAKAEADKQAAKAAKDAEAAKAKAEAAKAAKDAKAAKTETAKAAK